ncbi:MAG: hypothetical protein KTR19_05030 [Hyphomicrobiales bacterium]|nr:hypothetical protein [Hyphomicrobiales bacterium]
MNDVSWKKILEQVDRKQQLGSDADMQHHPACAYPPEQHSQSDADWSKLDPAFAPEVRQDRKPARARQRQSLRQRQPSPGQHATQLKMRMEQHSAKDVLVIPQQQVRPAKTFGDNTRNFVALSLALAVVVYTGYQLSNRAPDIGADNELTSARHANNASYADVFGADNIEPLSSRFDLRSSLASQSNALPESLPASETTGAITKIDPDDIANMLPATDLQKIETEDSEKLILSRGRNILERGHVSGARLIFEYLADRGSALGAFALAQTYDANFISKHALPADAADQAMANRWYQKAADMTDLAQAANQ